MISPVGTKFTKKDVIANLYKQEIVTTHMDSSDVRLLTGDVGIITSFTTFVVKADGNNVTGKNCYQDIYVKRKGRWFAVSAHVTLLTVK